MQARHVTACINLQREALPNSRTQAFVKFRGTVGSYLLPLTPLLRPLASLLTFNFSLTRTCRRPLNIEVIFPPIRCFSSSSRPYQAPSSPPSSLLLSVFRLMTDRCRRGGFWSAESVATHVYSMRLKGAEGFMGWRVHFWQYLRTQEPLVTTQHSAVKIFRILIIFYTRNGSIGLICPNIKVTFKHLMKLNLKPFRTKVTVRSIKFHRTSELWSNRDVMVWVWGSHESGSERKWPTIPALQPMWPVRGYNGPMRSNSIIKTSFHASFHRNLPY